MGTDIKWGLHIENQTLLLLSSPKIKRGDGVDKCCSFDAFCTALGLLGKLRRLVGVYRAWAERFVDETVPCVLAPHCIEQEATQVTRQTGILNNSRDLDFRIIVTELLATSALSEINLWFSSRQGKNEQGDASHS